MLLGGHAQTDAAIVPPHLRCGVDSVGGMYRELGRNFIVLTLLLLPGWLFVRLRYGRRVEAPSLALDLTWLVTVLYLAVVASITIVPLRIASDSRRGAINLHPGRAITCLVGPGPALQGSTRCVVNLAGNIALFLPFGMLLPLVSNRVRSLGIVAVLALGASASIELIQLAERSIGTWRTIDIDDVGLNVAGACLGYVVRPVRRLAR